MKRLFVITALVALVALANTASARPISMVALNGKAGDTTAKKDKQASSKKKADSKAGKNGHNDNLAEPDSVQDDEGQSQSWDTDLFVERDPVVTGETPRILAK